MPIAGVPSDNTTMVAILDDLRAAGYDGDVIVTPEAHLLCGACRHEVEPEAMQVDLIRRVEGASDPSDMAAVLALECVACGAKGTAIVRFGPEAEAHEGEVLERIEDRRPD